MTSKQIVLAKFPKAELVRDGWDEKAGPSGCFDFAIYSGRSFLAQGNNPRTAWNRAAVLLETRTK